MQKALNGFSACNILMAVITRLDRAVGQSLRGQWFVETGHGAIEDLLLELGVEVVGPAYGLETALHLARTADVEAAVLDIRIKGEFSYPVADALLARGIPIISATGSGERAIPKRFKKVPTLHKPFESARFHQILTEGLSDAPCEIS